MNIKIAELYFHEFISFEVWPTDKILIEKMLIYQRNMHRKTQTSILINGKDGYVSDGRTDILVNRVA